MRFNWAKSNVVSKLFFWSDVVFLSSFAAAFLIVSPWIQPLWTSPSANSFMGGLFIALVVMSIPSMLIMFFGMAVFCACVDDASAGVKVLWFVLFFGTGPIGSTVYYFSVYRGYIKSASADPSMIVGADGQIDPPKAQPKHS